MVSVSLQSGVILYDSFIFVKKIGDRVRYMKIKGKSLSKQLGNKTTTLRRSMFYSDSDPI